MRPFSITMLVGPRGALPGSARTRAAWTTTTSASAAGATGSASASARVNGVAARTDRDMVASGGRGGGADGGGKHTQGSGARSSAHPR